MFVYMYVTEQVRASILQSFVRNCLCLCVFVCLKQLNGHIKRRKWNEKIIIFTRQI